MTSKFRPGFRSRILLLLISAILTGECAAKSTPSRTTRVAGNDLERTESADNLAEEIKGIASSRAISRAKKEKRISTAVRVAIVAATAYKKDSEDVLGTALELTRAAAAAAPSFAEVISNAASFAPSLARIDSAPGRIRAAAFSAARTPGNARHVASVHKKRAPARVVAEEEQPQSEPEEMASEEPVKRRSAPRRVIEESADYPAPEQSASPSKVISDRNSNFSVSAEVSVRRDDNVYLTSSEPPPGVANSEKVSDTIIAVTPGIEAHFGQNSLAHGSVSYKNAFTRYADKTAPNVSLGSGAADFGYDSGNVAVKGDATFQQSNQNNADVAAVGQKAIFRRDLISAHASVEPHITAKTSIKTGVNFLDYRYKNDTLVGSRETEVPLKVYYETTPKVSVSAGVAYRSVNPIHGGVKGHDLDYSIGARGDFTPKLSGELSVDYRTRTVGNNPRDNLWGLNGALNYEITPKTTSSLIFSRDFRTGAFGESLKDSNYALRVTTDLNPQWQVSTGINFRKIDYGLPLFANRILSPVARTDDYWEGDLQISYLIRSWMNASVDYTIRHNQSTLPGADFSNSIISLMLGFRY